MLQGSDLEPLGRLVTGVLAFVAGFAADAIGVEKRINLLAPPLLALLAWNLFVYLAFWRAASGACSPAHAGLPGRWRAPSRVLTRHKPPRRHGTVPAAAFFADWAQASTTLTAARIGRVLHVAAIAFALGALAGMYLRGLRSSTGPAGRAPSSTPTRCARCSAPCSGQPRR